MNATRSADLAALAVELADAVDEVWVEGDSWDITALREAQVKVRAAASAAVPGTGQAREPGYERIAAAIAAACEVADLDLFAVQDGHGHPEPTYLLAKVLDKAGLIDWNAFDEPSGDTAQAPDVADLAYARSEVDKWLADNDPYCILPTRTEHIPALLARLDELEGTS